MVNWQPFDYRTARRVEGSITDKVIEDSEVVKQLTALTAALVCTLSRPAALSHTPPSHHHFHRCLDRVTPFLYDGYETCWNTEANALLDEVSVMFLKFIWGYLLFNDLFARTLKRILAKVRGKNYPKRVIILWINDELKFRLFSSVFDIVYAILLRTQRAMLSLFGIL